MSGVRMMHFLKDWWKFIQIHQYYTMALMLNATCGRNFMEICNACKCVILHTFKIQTLICCNILVTSIDKPFHSKYKKYGNTGMKEGSFKLPISSYFQQLNGKFNIVTFPTHV